MSPCDTFLFTLIQSGRLLRLSRDLIPHLEDEGLTGVKSTRISILIFRRISGVADLCVFLCVCVCVTKVWQCGGSVEVLPCSRIAHIERAHKPYTANLTALVRRNALRVADVWMDQYRSHVYMAWNVPLQVNITCVCLYVCVCVGSLILCSFSLCGRVCVGVIAYMLIYVQKLCHTSPSNRDRLHHVGPLEDHLCISNV